MFKVKLRASVWVIKYASRFFEGDSMVPQVDRGLIRVPFKFKLLHFFSSSFTSNPLAELDLSVARTTSQIIKQTPTGTHAMKKMSRTSAPLTSNLHPHPPLAVLSSSRAGCS